MNSNHSWIKDLEYIIWDLDGTLYKVTPQLFDAIELNVLQLIADFRGISLEEAKQLHQQLYEKFHSNTLVINSIGVDRDLAQKEINDTLIKSIVPNKMLVDQIKALRKVKHIVNTNSPQEFAEIKLKTIGFDDGFFEAVIGNPDIVGSLKPEFEPYKYTLNLTQTPADKHLFVGDRYETDLATAKKMGMYTALVHAKDERADLEFESASALIEYLAQVLE